METKKAPLSIRIIYWVTNISFWLFVFLSFGLLVNSISIYTSTKTSVMDFGRYLPINIGMQVTGHLDLNNQSTILKFTTFPDIVEVINPPRFIIKNIVLINLFMLLILTYVFWIFRKFIKNVKNGDIFSIKNISLLKRISYVLIFSWSIKIIYSQFVHFYITDHLLLDHVQMISGKVNLHIITLWVALFIWVLAHIFITGLKLQQEKDLTI